MATNSQNIYPIVANTVPEDRQCVQNATQILALVQDFCAVQGLAGNSGSSFPSQDTLGQQALQLAQQLQLQLASLAAQTLVFRMASNGFQTVPTSSAGGGVYDVPVTFSNPMPTSSYDVFISLQGGPTSVATASTFSCYVLTGTQTANGFTIHFEDPPPAARGWQYSWFAVQAPSAGAITTVISGFSPEIGAVGTNVTIYGSGFTGAQNVQLNGVACSFSITNDLQIVAVVPAAAVTGTFSVQTGTGIYISADTFTVT